MSCIVGLVAPLLLSLSQDSVYYRAPDSADPEDLPKAASAMAARCKAYGYKGIQTSIVDRDCRRLIQISCDSGLTGEMKRTLDSLAQLSGSSVEVRFPAYLSEVEKEQYQARANPCDDTSPPGASWYRFRNPDETPVLLREEPVATRNEILMRTVKDKSGTTRTFWELSVLQTREIREAERKGKLGTPYLLLDGLVVEAVPLSTLEKNDEGKIVPAPKMSFTPVSHLVQVALANPMPFSLENEETADRN